MADAIITADSAARLDPTPLIAKPSRSHGHGAVVRSRVRITA